VFLSLKALKEDPWAIGDQFKAGDTVKGAFYKFNPFGAVVAIDDNFQGLVHISEFGGQEEMKKAIAIGESYPFVIDSVKPDEKRITLKVQRRDL
jgi:small subunit ribosomal protein S1